MDVALAIDGLVPAAKYGGSVTDNSKKSFDALLWEDARPKPTWGSITAWWDANGAQVMEDQAAEDLITAEARQMVQEMAVERLKKAGKLSAGFDLKR